MQKEADKIIAEYKIKFNDKFPDAAKNFEEYLNEYVGGCLMRPDICEWFKATDKEIEARLKEIKMTVKQMQVVFLSGLAVFFIVAFLGAGIVSLSAKLDKTKMQLEEVEDNFQTFRAAAHDAFAWALGMEEGGERIPAGFFWRYEDNVKTAEESAALYFQACEIVKER